MNININDHVLVKLTPDGWKTYEEWQDHWLKPLLYIFPNAYEIERKSTEAGDKHRFQIWQLMQIFGEKMYNGGRQQFENNIIDWEGEA
jgi:hypothetical protein